MTPRVRIHIATANPVTRIELHDVLTTAPPPPPKEHRNRAEARRRLRPASGAAMAAKAGVR